MGLVASQARLLMLYARQSDLEFVTESISQQLMTLSANTSNLAMQEANLSMQNSNGNNAAIQNQLNQIEYKKEALHQREKYLELAMKQYENQHKMVQTEVESVQKIIDKNVEQTFKYMA